MRRTLILAVLAAAALTGLTGCALTQVACEDLRFDRAAWKASMASSKIDDFTAEDMAADLVRCHAFKGLTRAEVRRMLGRPGHYERPPGPGEWWWDVGEAELVVLFGRQGHVRDASLDHGDDLD